MSNTKREPLLSDDAKELERIGWKECATLRQGPKDPYGPMMESWNRGGFIRGLRYGQGIYEAARAKDAELIQMLVDDLRLLRIEFGNRVGQTTEIGIASLYNAEAAGFKPSYP